MEIVVSQNVLQPPSAFLLWPSRPEAGAADGTAVAAPIIYRASLLHGRDAKRENRYMSHL